MPKVPIVRGTDWSEVPEGSILANVGGVPTPRDVQASNQGRVDDVIVFDRDGAGSDLPITSLTFVALTGALGNFEMPHDGEVEIELHASMLENGTAPSRPKFRLNIDAGAQFAPPTEEPQFTKNLQSSENDHIFATTKATLTKGTHSIQVEARVAVAGDSVTFRDLNPALEGIKVRVRVLGGTATIFRAVARNAAFGSTLTKSDAAFAAIEAGVSDGTLTVPADGFYDLDFEINPYATSDLAGVEFELSIGGTPVDTFGIFGLRNGGREHISWRHPQLLTEGDTAWELKWRRDATSGAGVVTADVLTTIKLFVSGGAATNAALSARGDGNSKERSVVIEHQITPSALQTFDYILIGATSRAVSLRGLTLSTSSAVTVGTVTGTLRVNGVDEYSVVLDNTTGAVVTDTATNPAIGAESTLELKIEASADYENAAADFAQIVLEYELSVSTIISGSSGSGLGTDDPFGVKPTGPEVVFTDYFESTTLGVAWTPTAAVVGTVDPVSTTIATNANYDLTTRPGNLLVQCPRDNAVGPVFEVDVLQSTDMTFVARMDSFQARVALGQVFDRLGMSIETAAGIGFMKLSAQTARGGSGGFQVEFQRSSPDTFFNYEEKASGSLSQELVSGYFIIYKKASNWTGYFLDPVGRSYNHIGIFADPEAAGPDIKFKLFCRGNAGWPVDAIFGFSRVAVYNVIKAF